MARREPEFNPKPGVITVYCDIACPWAGLALHGLRRAREALELRRVQIDLRAFPLELVNERGTQRPLLDAQIAVIGGLEPSLRWRLWDAPDWQYPVTSLLAMEAVQAAKRPEVGGLAASDELDAALRHAFYAQSRCVSLLPVIREVAQTCRAVNVDTLTKAMQLGSGRAEVISQWRNAGDGAVPGSPHVFLPDGSEWHNPGVEFTWVGEPDRGYPVIAAYDPTVYEEILRSAFPS